MKNKITQYNSLIESIGRILQEGRQKAYSTVNNIIIRTYWSIGKMIVEYEQKGSKKAEYGEELLLKLSKELKLRYGKGFSRSNLTYMRQLYYKYPKCETLSHKLSWSHYFELLKIEDNNERSFYEKQCINDMWSVRELKRQKESLLFFRLSLGRDDKKIQKLATKGQIIETEKDIVKEPYILEFLGIKEDCSEKELEQKIIDNLQMFILELGKGFTFVARQHRITLDNTNFYVDLVFYHRILRCFVLIDLKIGRVTHTDVGQMNLYLNYFEAEENNLSDNKPIGIILGTEKNNIIIEYALGGITNNLFVSKYKLYLPSKEELKKEIERIRR